MKCGVGRRCASVSSLLTKKYNWTKIDKQIQICCNNEIKSKSLFWAQTHFSRHSKHANLLCSSWAATINHTHTFGPDLKWRYFFVSHFLFLKLNFDTIASKNVVYTTEFPNNNQNIYIYTYETIVNEIILKRTK